jgi:thiol-disulfide isomerase/thioredoxin
MHQNRTRTIKRLAVGIVMTGLMLVAASLTAEPAPRFWISNLEGERFISQRHEGVIILSFFYIGCVPCVIEIPELYRLVRPEDRQPHVALLYIDPIEADSKDAIREYAGRRNVPVRYFYHDPLGNLLKKFYDQKMTFPAIVVIKDSEIVLRTHVLDKAAVSAIEKALR